jgi:hypothetical protein
MRSFRRGLKSNFKALSDLAPRGRAGSISNASPEKANNDSFLQVPK